MSLLATSILTLALLLLASPAWADITTGVVGVWRFNEGFGTTTADSSGLGHTGTLKPTAGEPAWNTATGKFGSSLTFNGTTQYVEVPAHADFNITGALTIAAWVKTGGTGGRTIIAKSNSTTIDWSLYITNSGAVSFYDDAQAPGGATSGGTISNGAWRHVACTRSANTILLYIDGVQSGSAVTVGSGPFNANSLTVNLGWDKFTGVDFFPGDLDSVYVYNRALSAGDIAELAADTLWAWWKFDEPSGTLAVDQGEYSLDGTLTGGATFTAPGQIGPQAVTLNGTTGYVQVSSATNLGLVATSNYSWSFWVKPTAFTAFQGLLAQYITVNTAPGFLIYVHSTSDTTYGPVTAGVSAAWSLIAGTVAAHTTNNVLTANTWAHVVVVYTGSVAQASRLAIYVNGTDVTVLPLSSTGTVADMATVGIRLGTDTYTSDPFFGGSIDQVRLYKKALSGAEIAALYAEGGAPAAPTARTRRLILY